MYEKRELLGKLFFAAAIVILLYMLISPLTNTIINIDEYWTYSLVNLPFMQGMIVAVHDVHPPLYYLILYLFTPFGLDNLYLLKVLSIVPYALLMVVSATRIRQDYGWLTAGLFIFSIGVMSDFFCEFLTIRMYSWGLFFMVMMFIYYNDVITKWDRRSWVLLTLFTLLCAYTQYMFAITCALIYLLLLVEIWQNHKDRLKDFGKSLLALILLYAPWGVVFIYQIKTQSEDVHEAFGFADFIHYLTSFAIKSQNFSMQNVAFKIIAFAFLAFLLVMIYKKRDKLSATGIFLMYATLVIGVVGLMFSFCNTMRVRYLVPVFGIFWLSASIVIGRIEDGKILALALGLVVVLAGASIVITHDDIGSRLAFNDEKAAYLDSINNNSTVVVYNSDYAYKVLHKDLNNTHQYTLGGKYFYDDDVKISKNLTEILNKNHGKNIYVVNWKNHPDNAKVKKYDLNKTYDAGHYSFNLVEG